MRWRGKEVENGRERGVVNEGGRGLGRMRGWKMEKKKIEGIAFLIYSLGCCFFPRYDCAKLGR